MRDLTKVLERRRRRLMRWHRLRRLAYRLELDQPHRRPDDGMTWHHYLGPRHIDNRELVAMHHGQEIAVLDYYVCHHCRIGWIAKVTVHESWGRRGIATRLLVMARDEAPGYLWSTSRHRRSAAGFWVKVAERFDGEYQPVNRCGHIGTPVQVRKR